MKKNTAQLISHPWCVTSVGKSRGFNDYVDPATGWSYDVSIKWNDDAQTELEFGITYQHYEEMKVIYDTLETDEWITEPVPAWIVEMIEKMEAEQLDNILALDGRIFATLNDDEYKTYEFYRDQGRKYGVFVKVINEADPELLVQATSCLQAEQILKSANSRLSVSIEQ